MQANITYPEIQKYISDHYAKQISLAHIDNSTIRISTDIQFCRLSKTIHVDLKVEEIRGTDLYLSYSGGLSVELVIAPLLSFIKRLIPDKTGFVQENGSHQLIVHLAEIEQAKKVLEIMDLNSILFDQEKICVNLRLK